MKRLLASAILATLPVFASAAEKVTLKTNKGEIVIELDSAKAPLTAKNFLTYVKAKHYDGTVFHRVIPGFMIQGGGFGAKDGKLTEKATEKPVKNESSNGLKNVRGSIAMARTSDPDSATAQFFINVKDNPSLDFPSMGGYAVFGKVVKGMDVVDQIKAVETGVKPLVMTGPGGEKITAPSQDVPVADVIIESATAAE